MRFVHFGAPVTRPVTRLIVCLLSCSACYFVPFIKRSALIASFWFRVEYSSSSMFCRSLFEFQSSRETGRFFIELSASSRVEESRFSWDHGCAAVGPFTSPPSKTVGSLC